jgi:hypothetical protein
MFKKTTTPIKNITNIQRPFSVKKIENVHRRIIYNNPLAKTFWEMPKYNVEYKIFEFINLNSDGNRIPKNILSDDDNFIRYSEYTRFQIPTEKEHDDVFVSKLINICKFLYDNGGIYLNKPLKTHPEIFIKNNEMVRYEKNIDYFSCEKNSQIMADIISKLLPLTNPTTNELIEIFDSYRDDVYLLNNSFRFLI